MTGFAGKPQGHSAPKVLRAGDPGADLVVVYNRETGEEMPLVAAVCVEEGWLEQIRHIVRDDGSLWVVPDVFGEVIYDRIEGPWALRAGQLKHRQVRTLDSREAMNVVRWDPDGSIRIRARESIRIQAERLDLFHRQP
jgi:hypothetical protein